MATVAGFTPLCTLGRGSTATVSLASDLSSGRLVAIKSAELSRSSPLQQEHCILSSLNSPYIISCQGCYTSNSHFHLLLEFVSGGSLFDRIGSHAEGRLDENDIRLYVRDILIGLSYLHSNSISHGDIKSQNILIGSDGRAKIADFGAAIQTGGTHDGKSSLLSGTPAFMAPEVARGEERGPEADIWALGCTILEMATGKAPWHGIIKDQDVVAAVYRIGYCSDSMPDMPDWLSEEGKNFLMNCLRRDPKERWLADQLLSHPYVRVCDAGSKRDGNLNPTSSPQSALDSGLVFHDSETEDELEEEETGSNAAERIRELAGVGFGLGVFDSNPDEEGWIEVRSSNGGGNGEDENSGHVLFLDYEDYSDLVLPNLNFDVILERTNEEVECFLDYIYDFDVSTKKSINKVVNSSFDQTLKSCSVSSVSFLSNLCGISNISLFSYFNSIFLNLVFIFLAKS